MLFHTLDRCKKMSVSLKYEKSFIYEVQFSSYYPFFPKLLKYRVVAMVMKRQRHWAVVWFCWNVGSENHKHSSASTPPCSWIRMQHKELRLGEPCRAQSKHRHNLQQISDNSTSARLIARACSEHRIPLLSTALQPHSSEMAGVSASAVHANRFYYGYCFVLMCHLTIYFKFSWTLNSLTAYFSLLPLYCTNARYTAMGIIP